MTLGPLYQILRCEFGFISGLYSDLTKFFLYFCLIRRYLRSGFADTDLLQIFGEGTSKDGAGSGKVGYLEYLVGNGHTEASGKGRIIHFEQYP